MKKVFKYGTGKPIPKGAIYLSTQVETVTEEMINDSKKVHLTRNILVWHYFLVEVEEKNDKSKS